MCKREDRGYKQKPHFRMDSGGHVGSTDDQSSEDDSIRGLNNADEDDNKEGFADDYEGNIIYFIVQ